MSLKVDVLSYTDMSYLFTFPNIYRDLNVYKRDWETSTSVVKFIKTTCYTERKQCLFLETI